MPVTTFGPEEIAAVNQQLESKPPEAILRWAVESSIPA